MQLNSIIIGKPEMVWGFLALVPFILFYLIRPRMKEKEIPSLMFLMKNNKQLKQSSFLRYLIRSFLFLVQLIIITGLASSLVFPYITIPYAASSANTVVIIDGSASMHTKYGASTRFDRAISEIKPRLTGKISVIFAANQPLILLKDERKEEAIGLLSKLDAKSTSTNIGDAMAIAKDMLKGKTGKVIVASDFVSDEDTDIQAIRRDLMAKGNIVEFISVANSARNIGVIDLNIDKHNTKVRIKNYLDEGMDVKVKLIKEDDVLDEVPLSMAANSVEALSFETPLGISKIELEVNDDFDIDNNAYISTPLSKKIDVLLITNKKKSYLQYALEASNDIELEIRNPPTVNAFNIDHDVVIMHEIDKEELIPSDIVDIKRYVENGGNLIITAQNDLAQIDMRGMLPIEIEDISNQAVICVDLINEFTQQFDENKCFTSSKYFRGNLKEGAIPIASAGANPVIISRDQKDGTVFFYGIFDDLSNFKTQPAYPIFWNQLINHLVDTGNINDYNFDTGTLISIKEQKVTTPTMKLKTSKLILDEVGLYQLETKTIATNLVDEKESDVSGESILEEETTESIRGNEKEDTDMSLELPLIILAVFLLLIELFYIKRRGDI